MLDRPSRKCESRFKRDVEVNNSKKRRSLGREQVVADKRKLDVDVLETPKATKVAPISFTPNPTLTPRVQDPRISISPFVLQDVPSIEPRDWDPSPVVGRKKAPSTTQPQSVLWQLSDVEDSDIEVDEPPGLSHASDTEDEEEVEVDSETLIIAKKHKKQPTNRVTCSVSVNECSGIQPLETCEKTVESVNTGKSEPTVGSMQCSRGFRRDCSHPTTCPFWHTGFIYHIKNRVSHCIMPHYDKPTISTS